MSSGVHQMSGEHLQAECERLRQRVKQLEEERDRDQQALATLQSERDAYRRAVYAWALEQSSAEDLQSYAKMEDFTVSSAEILELLSQLENKGILPGADQPTA